MYIIYRHYVVFREFGKYIYSLYVLACLTVNDHVFGDW